MENHFEKLNDEAIKRQDRWRKSQDEISRIERLGDEKTAEEDYKMFDLALSQEGIKLAAEDEAYKMQEEIGKIENSISSGRDNVLKDLREKFELYHVAINARKRGQQGGINEDFLKALTKVVDKLDLYRIAAVNC